MTKDFKISILTPCFNSGQYIERAIQSVLNQNYANFEHIVVDGGSKDNTLEILRKYPHISWISEPDNGQSDAMNKAFEMSTGDIISYLNADDEYSPSTFVEVNRFYLENPKAPFLVGEINMMIWDKASLKVKSKFTYYQITRHFKFGFPNNPVGYFYKRSVQLNIGPFPVSNHFTMDYWFLLRVYRNYKVFNVDMVFGNYYLTADNKTSTINPIQECRKVFLEFSKEFDLINYFLYKLEYKIWKLSKKYGFQ